MNLLIRLPRWVSWPFSVAVAVALVSVLHPGGLSAAIDDVSSSNEWDERVQAYQSEDLVLQDGLTSVLDRAARKENLLTEWTSGRIDFRTLTERFRELNRGVGYMVCLSRQRSVDGLSDEELAAVNAAMHLMAHLRSTHAGYQHEERLHREYKAMFGHPLPEVR